MQTWYAVAIGLLGAQRIGELLYARRTARILRERGAQAVRRDGMAAIVAVHCLFFVGIVCETLWAPWAGTGGMPVLVVGLVLFVTGEVLRYTSMAALGWRWNTRVFVLPGAGLVLRGPYRFLRHPIYVGVVFELAGFALMGSLWVTAVVATALNWLALRRRIHIESAALRSSNSSSPADGSPVP